MIVAVDTNEIQKRLNTDILDKYLKETGLSKEHIIDNWNISSDIIISMLKEYKLGGIKG